MAQAHAAAITPNTTVDELNSDGDCSLREAIHAANTDAAVDACTAGSGADTINVPGGTVTLSVAGTGEDGNVTGDLDVREDLTISGAGSATTIIDGASVDRVFHIDPASSGVTTEIFGATVQNGLAASDGLASFGGGILNNGTLILDNSTVRNNTGATLDVFGGGIENRGTLTLNDSAVSENGSRDQAVFGGGILNAGTATLNRSTVNGNSTGSSGGGIENRGTLTVDNSTISGNTAFSGGAISGGVATITSSTVTGNTAIFGGGIAIGGLLTLTNTIVGKNTASGSGGDCIGAPTSLGHNLDSDTSCGLTGPGDISGVDPRLGPLADNGGPTRTHALLEGSPAIDAGNSDCPPPATDQRGVRRPQGAACDIGALEVTINRPPDCSGVVATPSMLWPPNHKVRLVNLGGATDPDGNTVTLTITAVAQDEPLNGPGDGNTSPDARAGAEPNEVLLRAERSGRRDGRVYRVSFAASDGNGGSCSGTVTVGVPRNASSTAVDSAPPSHNSFGP